MAINIIYSVPAYDLTICESIPIGISETVIVGTNHGNEILTRLLRCEYFVDNSALLFGDNRFGGKSTKFTAMVSRWRGTSRSSADPAFALNSPGSNEIRNFRICKANPSPQKNHS